MDQSEEFISGYSDNIDFLNYISKDVIVFGDHTRNIKYLNFNFIAGADGIKILKPNDNVLPKYLFYVLKNTKIENLGYSRHFKILKILKIPLPPLEKQQEIVDEIEQYQKVIDGARQVVESYRPTFLEDGEWHEVKLSEVTKLIKRGITPKYSENSGALVINQRCIRDFEVNLENARLHDLEKKSIPEDKKIKQFDVLVNSTGVGTLGRVAQFINEPDESTTVDSHVTIIRLNSELIEDEFFGIAMYNLQNTIELLGKGSSGQTELSAGSLAELIIRYPAKKEVQREIINTIKSEKQTVQQNKNLINKYQNLIDQKIASLYT